jgi:hypothetical protein
MTKQVINVGTLPNDHTGDKNRAGWIKTNSNFNELYGLVGMISPVAGTKYPDFRIAVKHFIISEQNLNNLFYISQIINGTSAGEGLYNYQVDIKRVSTLTGAGDLVMTWSQVYNHRLTDPIFIALGPVSPFIYNAMMVIDFSGMNSSLYTCANWIQGGLMNPAMAKAETGGGIAPGGGNATLPEYNGSFEADGSLPIYMVNSADPVTCTISAIGDVVGDIKIKNKGVGVVTIVSVDNLQIDGSPSIQLAQGEFSTILKNVDKFEAFGQYTCVPLGGGLHMQAFTATEGQTEFVVTELTLTDAVQVFLDGNLQEDNYTRTGNTITFSGGLGVGQKVKIYN